MNEMRREILEMLFDTDSIRPAAVRRSFLEDYLYATDLPLTASEETLVKVIIKPMCLSQYVFTHQTTGPPDSPHTSQHWHKDN